MQNHPTVKPIDTAVYQRWELEGADPIPDYADRGLFTPVHVETMSDNSDDSPLLRISVRGPLVDSPTLHGSASHHLHGDGGLWGTWPEWVSDTLACLIESTEEVTEKGIVDAIATRDFLIGANKLAAAEEASK